MIYLLAAALVLTAFGFVRQAREKGFRIVLLDVIVAAAFGWLAGVFIGVGARVGMWTIPFLNGGTPQITADGTFRVILTFSLYGIILGVIYEALFRGILRKSGLAYGVLVMLCSWYPLGAAGVQQVNFQPPVLPLILVTGLVMALMFWPYGFVLEVLLGRWHAWRDWSASVPLAINAERERSFINQRN